MFDLALETRTCASRQAFARSADEQFVVIARHARCLPGLDRFGCRELTLLCHAILLETAPHLIRHASADKQFVVIGRQPRGLPGLDRFRCCKLALLRHRCALLEI